MARHDKPKNASQVDGAPVLIVPASTGRRADDHAVWLDQATRVRDKAFHFLQRRFMNDVGEAAQFLGSIDPNALARQMDYATKLTTEYLAESDRMFELMTRLAQNGRLETRRRCT